MKKIFIIILMFSSISSTFANNNIFWNNNWNINYDISWWNEREVKNEYNWVNFWDSPNVNAWDSSSDTENINITNPWDWSNPDYDRLWWIKTSNHFDASVTWQKWIAALIVTIAKEVKNIVVWVMIILMLIWTLRLIFASNSDEEKTKYKWMILWAWAWIMLMQIAETSTIYLFDRDITAQRAVSFTQAVIQPFISLLTYVWSFLFMWVAILSFYKLVSANWDDWKASEAKMSIIYWVMWMITLKVSWVLISAFYWKIECWSGVNDSCIKEENLSDWVKLITDILNWVNSFIIIITTLLIIYTGYILIFANWDESKLQEWKNLIKYIVIWLALVGWSYILMEFAIDFRS